MVKYVVYRQEVPRPPEKGAVRRWHSTDSLAHLYGKEPDPLQRALLLTYHHLPETQKAKRSLAQYAKFIRNGIVERFKNPASRGSGVGEIVKVEVRQSESLERKVEDVCRSLRFYQDTVEKGILAMLPGSATIVLEMVLALTLALKPCFSNQLSSALTSVLGQVHQSVGELVRWSDQHMLYGDKACTSASVREVVEAVHKAVKELVDLAVDKENVNLSDSSLLDLPLSNTFPKKDVGFSKRISENGNASHRSSLPEITSLSPTDSEKTFITSTPDSGSTPAKLCHSLSSDSILNSQGEGGELVPPPKPPLPVVRHRPSFEGDIAPPLPPKKRGHPKGSSPVEDQSPPHGCGSPPGASPREGSTSPWCRRSTVSATSTVPDWSSSPLHHSGDLSPSSSQDSVTHEDLTQSSLDSSYSHNHSHLIDSFTFGHHSIGSDDFQTAFSKTFGPERLVMGYQFVDEPTLSPSYNSYSSSSSQHTSITQNSKSVSYSGETHFRSEAQSYSHKSQFVSRASQDDNHTVTLSVPPALPKKTRTPQQQVLMEVKKMECRTPSQYDNVPHDFNPADSEGYDEHISKHEGDPSPELPPKKSYSQYSSSSSCNSSFSSGYTSSSASSSTTNGSSSSVVQLRRHTCLVQQTQFSSSTVADVDTTPPPLPPKRKPVTDYIDVIKSEYNQPNANEFLRHSSLQLTYYQSQYNLHGKDFHGTDFYLHREGMHGTAHRMEMLALGDGLAPPALPPKQKTKQPAIEAPMEKLALTCQPVPQAITYPSLTPAITSSTLAVHNQCEEVKHEEEEEEEEEGPLDMLDVNDYLVLKKSGDDGPDIRGGPVDSLIVHASKANKNDFLYQEAFLTTYRTFISPGQLITKLLYRYNKFCKTSDPEKVKAGRNAFSLLVRVVDDLAITDLDIEILETLTQFVYNLLCHGDLLLARALRKKIVEKCESKQRYNAPKDNLTSLSISTRPATLLDFQAHEIAEQMTLLDAELFLKIEIPEVLIWAKEQNEETSPNLTQFTEHFNKMSYWARSRILEQEDARDREKYVARFIKIMKHLRKINNFNSYLAVLSALDSAPVRRLEWQRNITEGLKEYCALIDSSSSFRAYRQALAETTPPCIPYIGLILQDLTFVHIGNSDMINDDLVNFSKRWQQFNILDNMKRFKKCQYHFKKNDRIVAFFNSFINHLSEEALWDISEKIKPRKKKAVV